MPTDAYRDDELLRRWISGELTAPQEAELERRAARDPDLREALDGLSATPEADHGARIAAMVERARPAAPVRRIPYARYAAAATLLVLLSVAALLLPRYFGQTEDAPLAMTEAREAEPTPSPASQAPPAPASAPRDQEREEAAPLARQAPPEPVAALPIRRNRMAVQEQAQSVESIVEEAEADAAALSTTVTPPPPAPVLRGAPPPVVRRRTVAPPVAPREVSGRVTDANGDPLPNAEVRRVGQALGVTTDSSGTFTLPYDFTLNQLNVSRLGYEDETVEVFDTTASLQISLEEISRRAGYEAWMENAATSKIDIDPANPLRAQARPLEGYRELRQRIEAGRPDDVPTGRVRVSFLVDDAGKLSDFRFRGQPDGATMDYVGKTLVESSTWKVVTGEAPVRVYFTLRFE